MSSESLKQKAREICYALVKVSFYVKRPELKHRLERSAFELLENMACASIDITDKGMVQAVFKNIAALDSLVRVGHSLYEVEPVNATILIKELNTFHSAIRQFGNVDQELPKLESLFTAMPSQQPLPVASLMKSESWNGVSSLPMALPDETFEIKEGSNGYHENGNASTTLSVNGNGNGNGNGVNMAIRQSAIMDRIKSGNGIGCRLKDLITEFPHVSERTLRYDLQRLAEQGVVERIGNGGPATYYQLKS
ncbi:MAG: DeoR family transcriptional regulator [bacterium]|nr:DeoR family transcriptional regulator [bacterium]